MFNILKGDIVAFSEVPPLIEICVAFPIVLTV